MASALMLAARRSYGNSIIRSRSITSTLRVSRQNASTSYGRVHGMHSFLHRRPAFGPLNRMSRLHTGSRNLARANALQKTSRSLSYTAIPRLAFRVIGRLPVILAGGSVAGGAYVVTKVEAARTSVNEYLDDISATFGKAAGTIGTGVGSAFQTIGETANEAGDFGKDIWSRLRSTLGDLFEGEGESGRGDGSSGQGSSSKKSPDDPTPERIAAGAAVASSIPLALDTSRDDFDPTDEATNDLMVLTKKLIEIRSILLTIDHREGLQLPAIVTIGSQSSGKSSVLEAIVGREFLPKYVAPTFF